jgi:uncharacterized protein (TIGR02996 family)
MRTFQYSDAKSHKFWNIELQGKSFTVTYGRVGSKGQAQTKEFPSEDRARAAADKQIAEKLAKGYRETTPSARAPAAGLREALEEALAANPDDLASHMAYADWLSEQGDPRGELIQVQLALEDPGRSVDERKRLQQREQELLRAHARAWLGELAPFLLDQKPKKKRTWNDLRCEYRFARGWLDALEANSYTVAFTRTLARSPQIRLLRRLALADQAYEEEGDYEPGDDIPDDVEYYPQLYPLVRSPYLGNVRILQLGEQISAREDDEATDGGFNCRTEGEAAVGLVKLMPRLEELYLLAHDVDTDQLFTLKTLHNLRILQVYHNKRYPLQKLASNPSLGRLTHLLLHPHALDGEEPYIRLPGVRALVRSPHLKGLTHLRLRLSDMGDKGCREVVASGILRRLKVLDLRHGRITDEGARTLAESPDLKNLELLDLDNNCLTSAGISALRATGVRLSAKDQWQPSGDEVDDQEYLFAGDIE